MSLNEHRESPVLDTVVVGGGVAGLSAALFLGRAGRSVIVYDSGRQRIRAVERVREFLGFDGLSPDEMLLRCSQEVLSCGVPIRHESVENIHYRADGLFDVRTREGMVTARTVVLATGLKDDLPPLAGIRRVWGRDLRICPCFDGHEVSNRRFVVFGLHERLAQLGSWVSMWSPHVTVVTEHPLEPEEAEKLSLLGIKLVRDRVTGLVHENEHLAALALESGAHLACDAAWIVTALEAASHLAGSLCEVDQAGFAKTDEHGRTSRAGVFAVGNAVNPVAHLAHAAAAGTDVGPWVTSYLLDSRIAARRAMAGAARRGEGNETR
jgi:thioredoxin reductase